MHIDLEQIPARQIMSKEITTIIPSEKISTAEILMLKKNIGGLPVVHAETNQLLGMLTHRDIHLSRNIVGTQVFVVGDIYSKNPIYATPNDSVAFIIEKMTKYKIERIPIVNDQLQIVGLIVQHDIISYLGKLLRENRETVANIP